MCAPNIDPLFDWNGAAEDSKLRLTKGLRFSQWRPKTDSRSVGQPKERGLWTTPLSLGHTADFHREEEYFKPKNGFSCCSKGHNNEGYVTNPYTSTAEKHDKPHQGIGRRFLLHQTLLKKIQNDISFRHQLHLATGPNTDVVDEPYSWWKRSWWRAESF